jgi:hypothetical protein
MKLFLDDIRTPPDNTWFVVRTAEAAIEELKKGRVTVASLDHDLVDGHYPWNAGHPYPSNDSLVASTGFMTGLNVVLWMQENNIWPDVGVVVHSQNDEGRKRMMEVIDNHYIFRLRNA